VLLAALTTEAQMRKKPNNRLYAIKPGLVRMKIDLDGNTHVLTFFFLSFVSEVSFYRVTDFLCSYGIF